MRDAVQKQFITHINSSLIIHLRIYTNFNYIVLPVNIEILQREFLQTNFKTFYIRHVVIYLPTSAYICPKTPEITTYVLYRIVKYCSLSTDIKLIKFHR